MKMTVLAVTFLGALGLGGYTGQAPEYLTEYDAVGPDGPYSYLTPTFATDLERIGDTETDALTEVEAMATSALLDILAGGPADAPQPGAPLDGSAPSDTGLLLAGL